MTSRLFIDTNIPTYAAGNNHSLKEPCAQIIRFVAIYPDRFVTDAEVLQELLHRFHAIRSLDVGIDVLRYFGNLMRGRVESMTHKDVEQAVLIVRDNPRLSARDAIHVAVMQRIGTEDIITADRAFDHVAGIRRLDPRTIDTWSGEIG